MDIQKYPEIEKNATCLLTKLKILTATGLDIDGMLEKILASDTTYPAEYRTQLKTFFEICNSVRIQAIINCFKKNERRFGFQSRIVFDPMLKFSLNLASLLGVSNDTNFNNYNACFKRYQVKIHDVADIFVSFIDSRSDFNYIRYPE